MKYILKDCFGKTYYKNNDLDNVKLWLLGKYENHVYKGSLDKHTYNEVYNTIRYTNDLKEINDCLIYNFGIKILFIN